MVDLMHEAAKALLKRQPEKPDYSKLIIPEDLFKRENAVDRTDKLISDIREIVK